MTHPHIVLPPSPPPLAVTSTRCLHTHGHTPQLLSSFPFLSLSPSLLQFPAQSAPPLLPPPHLLQRLSAGQQRLLQLADAALQLFDLLVALPQLTTQLLGAEQQLTAPVCLLLQLGGQLLHLVTKRGRNNWPKRGGGGGERWFNEIRLQNKLATV